jgi:hypothetical protein
MATDDAKHAPTRGEGVGPARDPGGGGFGAVHRLIIPKKRDGPPGFIG